MELGGLMEYSTTFLTEREARTIPPPREHTHVEHWHQSETYFGTRVMRAKAKSGKVTRSWLVRWHEKGKDYRRVLGRVEEMPYRTAQREALEQIEKVKNSRSSGLNKTFRQAYADYVERKSKKWAPDTVINYKKSAAYLLLHWENTRIDRINDDECTRVYEQIKADVLKRGEDKNLNITVRDGSATAVSAMRLAKAIFAYYVKKGILSYNPCQALVDDGVFEPRPARSRMISADKLPTFWRWLHTYPLPAVRDYILMGLFMALRHSVLASLRWDNLIEQNGHYYYLMRSNQRGNKRKEEIPMPIPDYLVETVIKPRLASPTKHPIWIIESPKKLDQPLTSVRGSFEALSAKTGIKISDHDMRRSCSTLTNRLCGETLARRILTHAIDAKDVRHAVSSGYIITEVDELREGMNKVIQYVRSLCEEGVGKENKPSDLSDSRGHNKPA